MRYLLFLIVHGIIFSTIMFKHLYASEVNEKQTNSNSSVNNHLVKAKKMLHSKLFYQRMQAMKIIGRYKSEENKQLLLDMYEDNWSYLYGEGEIIMRFPVRALAYEILKGWNMKVQAPVYEVKCYGSN